MNDEFLFDYETFEHVGDDKLVRWLHRHFGAYAEAATPVQGFCVPYPEVSRDDAAVLVLAIKAKRLDIKPIYIKNNWHLAISTIRQKTDSLH